MRLRATATLSGVFPVNSDGKLARFAFSPDKLFGAEAELAARCPNIVFMGEDDMRKKTRAVPVHIVAGKIYGDETFQGLPGVVEHLVDRGVLIDTEPKAKPVETAPPMGDGQTQVEEGLVDGSGKLQSPKASKVSDDSSADEF